MISNWQKKLFSTHSDYNALAQVAWQHQYSQNAVCQRFADALQTQEAPFLPIECFKHFDLKAGEWQEEAIFESSGTTGQQPSRHFVRDLALYKRIAIEGFFRFFPKKEYKILALLPSYLERGNSSLVQMVRFWIESFGLPNSGFYLHNFEELAKAIYETEGEPILLIGVAYALLDFAEYFDGNMPPHTLVMETGGMKGRKAELTREELHTELQQGLGVSHIYSEYGMTELMSQAYFLQDKRFHAPPWLKIVISDIHLPTQTVPIGTTGRINVIDLGNIHTCSFISTDDLGKMHPDGSFEVLGRIDYAEMRGCNLMYIND